MDGALLGLVLTTLAGLATTVGSLIIFCINDYKPLPFAMCMAASAGVMVYISFVELLKAAQHHFFEAYKTQLTGEPAAQNWAYCMASLAFFLGWLFTSVFDKLIHYVTHHWHGPTLVRSTAEDTRSSSSPGYVTGAAMPSETSNATPSLSHLGSRLREQHFTTQRVQEAVGGYNDMEHGKRYTDDGPQSFCEENNEEHWSGPTIDGYCPSLRDAAALDRAPPFEITTLRDPKLRKPSSSIVQRNRHSQLPSVKCSKNAKATLNMLLLRLDTTETEAAEIAFAEVRFKRAQHNFVRLGLITAIALAVHNFPEGIATFTGSLANPTFGVGIAIAIGLHNIPEGFAVAVPIWFGTGSKWKGLLYSFLSGIAEPIGALLAYFVIGGRTDDILFGWTVGLTAGVMGNIALKELYPAALKCDPTNKVATLCFFVAMMLMSATLISLQFAGAP